MKRSTLAVPLGAVAVAGTAAYLVRASRRAKDHSGTPHVITVFLPPAEVEATLRRPLTSRDDDLDVRLREAPGGRGTEISVRSLTGAVTDAEIRRALRVGRSLLEVGEVLQPGVATTTPTPLNRLLRTATRHGREGGLL
jgi:hypothetical protein